MNACTCNAIPHRTSCAVFDAGPAKPPTAEWDRPTVEAILHAVEDVERDVRRGDDPRRPWRVLAKRLRKLLDG